MVPEKVLKAAVVVLVVYLVLSLALMMVGLMDNLVFWIGVLISAGFAFVVLPRINKKAPKP